LVQIYLFILCVGKNSVSFACEAVARVLGQANVPECTVGILFLSFILFTVVVFFTLSDNARLYAVGRGFSASYEIFRPNAADGGEGNPQYAVEPRLPNTALLAFCCFLSLAKVYFS
jgi:hypothetical protein